MRSPRKVRLLGMELLCAHVDAQLELWGEPERWPAVAGETNIIPQLAQRCPCTEKLRKETIPNRWLPFARFAQFQPYTILILERCLSISKNPMKTSLLSLSEASIKPRKDPDKFAV